ncbi:MAG: antitoxin VapB family protein [Candidatus Kariarchaeaceae archaeon]|jgi:predicted CopG family antitoxin
MATKTLSISEEAYNELIKLKETKESFSQLILRLTKKRGTPTTILKIIQDMHKEDFKASADLAKSIEEVYMNRHQDKPRSIEL